jgi:hypothetical protein
MSYRRSLPRSSVRVRPSSRSESTPPPGPPGAGDDLAVRFKMRGDQVSGRALVERARATFDQIGATGWVVEAQAALDG